MASSVLRTERLELREMGVDDADFMLQLLNEPSFIENVGDRGVRSAAEARRYILDGPVASYERFGFGLYVVELSALSLPIGICGLLRRDWLKDVDLGFAFLPRYWSRGYAYESGSAMTRYAQEVVGLSRITAITAPDNEPSMRVLGKLGFTFERMVERPNRETLRLFGYGARTDR